MPISKQKFIEWIQDQGIRISKDPVRNASSVVGVVFVVAFGFGNFFYTWYTNAAAAGREKIASAKSQEIAESSRAALEKAASANDASSIAQAKSARAQADMAELSSVSTELQRELTVLAEKSAEAHRDLASLQAEVNLFYSRYEKLVERSVMIQAGAAANQAQLTGLVGSMGSAQKYEEAKQDIAGRVFFSIYEISVDPESCQAYREQYKLIETGIVKTGQVSLADARSLINIAVARDETTRQLIKTVLQSNDKSWLRSLALELSHDETNRSVVKHFPALRALWNYEEYWTLLQLLNLVSPDFIDRENSAFERVIDEYFSGEASADTVDKLAAGITENIPWHIQLQGNANAAAHGGARNYVDERKAGFVSLLENVAILNAKRLSRYEK